LEKKLSKRHHRHHKHHGLHRSRASPSVAGPANIPLAPRSAPQTLAPQIVGKNGGGVYNPAAGSKARVRWVD